MNSEKIILDLCGGTGSWSEPYRKAGYDVHIITLPQLDVTKWIGCPASKSLDFIDDKNPLHINASKVHGILAAPPCTMFSRARTTAKTPRDFKEAMKVVRACLGIIWYCRIHGDLQWWALENPMGLLRQFLGKPAYSFQPFWFGDGHFKFTDLWGYFEKPHKMQGWRKPPGFNRIQWASPKKPKKYKDLSLSRAGIRSITPPGFARAFFKANP